VQAAKRKAVAIETDSDEEDSGGLGDQDLEDGGSGSKEEDKEEEGNRHSRASSGGPRRRSPRKRAEGAPLPIDSHKIHLGGGRRG
jgi:hypothetical protein